MSSRSSAGQLPYDQDVAKAVVIIGVFVAFALIQWKYGEFFRQSWLNWKALECRFLLTLPFYGADDRATFSAIINTIESRHSEDINERLYRAIVKTVHLEMRWLYMGAAAFLIPFLMFFKATKRGRLDAVELMGRHSRLYPWLRPIIRSPIGGTSMIEGPNRARMNPVEFCKHHRLINDKGLDRKKADLVFAAQLGKRLTNPTALNDNERTTLAIILAKAERDDELYDDLVSMSNDAVAGIVDKSRLKSRVRSALDKHWDGPASKHARERHAYFLTYVDGLMDEFIRGERGVFGSAGLRWLKPIERSLWYVFNDAGHNPSTEIAGIRAHRLFESQEARAISMPIVESATEALERKLWEFKAISIPDYVRREEAEMEALAAQRLEIERRRAPPAQGR